MRSDTILGWFIGANMVSRLSRTKERAFDPLSVLERYSPWPHLTHSNYCLKPSGDLPPSHGVQVHHLYNFRGTLFYPWPHVFRPLGQGGTCRFRRRAAAPRGGNLGVG